VKAKDKLLAIFQVLHDVRDETFGNGRLARNVFERAINNQANRIISLAHINDEVLSTIEATDIPEEVELRSIENLFRESNLISTMNDAARRSDSFWLGQRRRLTTCEGGCLQQSLDREIVTMAQS